ncbi:MAG: hypothetical protein H2172_08475 [Opitutus sp.]|nr:hypothetical protein [Opitutus sp.]MCS6246558.1 hypothetical protein [Opitutus sp.]MCS6272757.1 hypothetical protein [Opitutus sp.]MCS6276389.1 hypothetical protein [Opitutus sp.]MCS6301963.1 hypothetical protein [Opitutus sp.]
MIFSRSFLVVFIASWLGAANLLSGQTTAPGAKDKQAQVITFCMIGGKEVGSSGDQADKGTSFKFRADQVTKDLTLTPGQTRGPFTRKAEGRILIYRERRSPDPTQPPQIIPVAETTVDPSWRNIIVLVALNESSGEVSLKAINQSLDSIPVGSISFINLMPCELAVKLGSSSGTIPLKGRLTLPTGLTGDAAAMVELLVAAEIENEGRVINSTSQGLSPKDRRVALLYPGFLRPVQVMLLDPAPPDPVD